MWKTLKAWGAAAISSLGLLATQAHAALDTTAVGTSLTAAQGSGEDVGVMVIGVVAALVVIGIVISIVKKV